MSEKIYEGFKRERELYKQRNRILKEQQELSKPSTLEGQLLEDTMLSSYNTSVKREKSSYRLPGLIKDRTAKITESVIVDYLVEGYFNSLVIDDFVKLTEETQIKENAKIFFSELLKKKTVDGLFESCDSNMLREAILMIEAVASEVSTEDINNSIDDEGEAEEENSKEEAKRRLKGSVATKAMSNVSKEVASKVKAAIQTEKEIAEKNQEIEEELVTEGKNYRKTNPDVSLYRSIFQGVSTASLQESENINPDYVFTETQLQYTLLEYANTINLVQFSPKLVKNLSRAYRGV